jgi:16S rRNA (cytosine967-C5)-methyltransferase
MKISARTIAVEVLTRVERDRAYAAAALDAELDRHPGLDPRERALAAELVYGILRSRRALFKAIERHAPRGISDDAVRRHLLVAAYQLLLLDRIPAWAAVDEAVENLKAMRGARVAGFANAVLRKVGSDKLDPATAIRSSAPEWLFRALVETVGAEEADALFGIGVSLGQGWARLVNESHAPAWLRDAPAHPHVPNARVLPGGDPEKLEGFAEGAFVVQEPGAQLVALALGARPGERVLDACAGRGQKTLLLAERLGKDGEVWATDAHPNKLKALTREAVRLHLPQPKTAAVDYTLGPGDVPGDFDRVLVDAPCTGVGTLRRRPEIAERLAPDDPARLGRLAAQILRGAAGRARKGGRVVFAVCSVLREEAEDVVTAVSDILAPVPLDAPELAPLVTDSASSLRLLPRRHGTDGYFVASFVRR